MFRELKERTRRFYNNINSKIVKSIEEIATSTALTHNKHLKIQTERGITSMIVPLKGWDSYTFDIPLKS